MVICSVPYSFAVRTMRFDTASTEVTATGGTSTYWAVDRKIIKLSRTDEAKLMKDKL